jgi:hypothetical protein
VPCAKQGGRLFFEPYTIADGLRKRHRLHHAGGRPRQPVAVISRAVLARFSPRDSVSRPYPPISSNQRVDFTREPPVRLDDGRLLFPAPTTGPFCLQSCADGMSRMCHATSSHAFIGSGRGDTFGTAGSHHRLYTRIPRPHCASSRPNNFSIEFSALDFRNPQNNNYSYTKGLTDSGTTSDVVTRPSTATCRPGSFTLLMRSNQRRRRNGSTMSGRCPRHQASFLCRPGGPMCCTCWP